MTFARYAMGNITASLHSENGASFFDADAQLHPAYPDMLRWQKRYRIVEDLRNVYRRFCLAKGVTELEKCGDHELLQLLDLLGEEQLKDVFSAPRLSWRFLQKGFSVETDGGTIMEALIVEAARTGVPVTAWEKMYSPLCDYLLLPGKNTPRRLSAIAPDVPFILETCLTRNTFGDDVLNSSEHTAAERRKSILLVRRALSALKTAAPSAYNFVCDMITVLSFKGHRTERSFATGTFSGHTGFVLFTNTHHAAMIEVIEGLVHEAVHCILYRHEDIAGGFLLTGGQDDVLTSPWTHNRIRLHSFIHACFVWYAVHFLWQRLAEAGWNRDFALERTAFCQKGFLAKPVTEILQASGAVLRPGTLSCLKKIERVMICQSV